RLAPGLLHVRDDPLAVLRERLAPRIAVRKASEQRLVQEVLVVSRGRRLVVHRRLLALVHAIPFRELQAPARAQLPDHVPARQPAARSVSTSMRGRTVSERLLSCVEVASIVCCQCLARCALARWNFAGGKPNSSGSPPTSFRETRRLKR